MIQQIIPLQKFVGYHNGRMKTQIRPINEMTQGYTSLKLGSKWTSAVVLEAQHWLLLWCEIHKFIISNWGKEELPEVWKELIILPIYKKGDKTDCSNYRGMSLSPTTYKIFSNILLPRLTPHAEEITGQQVNY